MATALQQFDARPMKLAVTADRVILDRVKDVIARVLATGQDVGTAPDDIREILQAAGCLPDNPQYPEMCLRTNMMGAYSEKNEAEFNDPDVAASFPVWRYDGIEDGREGDDHRPHFGLYYPSYVTFAEVRGKRVYNCRCVKTPLYWRIWEKLKAAGARLADGYAEIQRVPPKPLTILLPERVRKALPAMLASAKTLADLKDDPTGRAWLLVNREAVKAELMSPKLREPEQPKTLPIAEPAKKQPAAKKLKPVPPQNVVTLPDGRDLEIIPHETAGKDSVLVMVDPQKLDAAWRMDKTDYVPPGGEAKFGARRGVEEFLKKGLPVQASRVSLLRDGSVYFTDGRHRFAVLRDAGVRRVGVSVPRSQAETFRQRFGVETVQKFAEEETTHAS